MKKILVLVVSSLVLSSCLQEEKRVEKVSVVSDAELVKVCDSLLFNGKTKIKVKVEDIVLEGKPIKLNGECVISITKEK